MRFENRIVCSDALVFLKKMPDECVNLVVTSPPYWNLRDYGKRTEMIWPDGWRGQLGMEPTWQMYVEHLVEVGREIMRVLRKDGSYYLVLGDTYAGGGHGGKTFYKTKSGEMVKSLKQGRSSNYVPQIKWKYNGVTRPKQKLLIPYRVAIALQEDGWICRNDITWNKPNAMPSSVKDRLTCVTERVFHFVKSRRYYYDLDAVRIPHKTDSFKRDEHGYRDAVKGRYKVPWEKREGLTTGSMLNPKGKNPGDVLQYDSKYAKTDYGQTLQAFIVSQSTAKARAQSRIDAKRLFPNDPKKQQEYINYIHDHYGHPKGRNPGDVIKHDIAVGRIGDYSYSDPLHTKPYNPKGRNPGDVFQTKRGPYIGNNPHRMRLEREQYLALNPSRPNDLSHPRGKNPGDVVKSKYLTPEGLKNKGASPGARTVLQRAYGERFTEKRGYEVNAKEIGAYLRKWKRKSGLTTKQIAEQLGQRLTLVEHYFRSDDTGTSIPDKNTWMALKNILRFDDKYDEAVCTTRMVSQTVRSHPLGRAPTDFWSITTQPFKDAHFAVFPEKLIEPIIKSGCPMYVCRKCGKPKEGHPCWIESCRCENPDLKRGLVLDPFCGSGTTCLVALKLGRNYLGIDINQAYCKMAEKRIDKLLESYII